MSTTNPLSPKVLAAAAGAGAGTIVSTFLLWILGVTVWSQSASADNVSAAIAAVPPPVAGLVLLVVTVIGTYVPGYTITDPLRQAAIARRLNPAPVQPVTADGRPVEQPEDDGLSQEYNG